MSRSGMMPGDLMKMLRQSKKMTQEEVAKLVEHLMQQEYPGRTFSQEAYFKYENNKVTSWDSDAVPFIAEALGTNTKYLLRYIDENLYNHIPEITRDWLISEECLPYIEEAHKKYISDKFSKKD